MEARCIEYPRSNNLDYHHNSPLIGEIPSNDQAQFHRSIDQLRSLNERGILNSNNFQNVIVPVSTNSIIVQASGMYSEIKIADDYHLSNKSLRLDIAGMIVNETLSEEQKCDDNDFQSDNLPHQLLIGATSIPPHNHSSFITLENNSKLENKGKTKVLK
jgi:hypothetical protein